MDVILVDEFDEPVGQMEKLEVHKKALLHRAFSIFIFNGRGEMLLHKRADSKYHSAGLWTNACCSHPQPGDKTIDAANKRLKEEMGISTTLHQAFSFTYKTSFENGLTEYEYDHVFIGNYDGVLNPDKNEVSDFGFLSMDQIKQDMAADPDKFTEWFKIAFAKVEDYLKTAGID